MYKIIYMAAEPTYVAAEPEFQESTSYVWGSSALC